MSAAIDQGAVSGLDLSFAMTTFKDYAAATKQQEEWTLRTLAPRISATTAGFKKALPWLKLAKFGDVRTEKNSLRHDDNVLEITGIEADYDAQLVTVADAVDLLEKAGILAMVYTSPSHTADTPRWRVLCPTSRPRPPEARAHLMGRLNGLFRGVLAAESFTLSQGYFFGSVKHNPSHEVHTIEGTPIDECSDLDEGWMGKPDTETRVTAGGERVSGPMDEAALLADLTSGASYHGAAVRLAGRWAKQGVPYMEARLRLLEAFDALPLGERDARWATRRGDMDRCLEDIYGKEALQKDHAASTGGGSAVGTPDAKRPLFRPLPAAPEFPMHALGALRDAAEAIQMRTQAPAAICSQSVLAAATLAVQAHRDVELPGGGRRPLTGLFASVAESGERKTSVDRIALAPAYRVEEQWRQDREGQVTAYANDLDAWKAAREAAKKKNKGDRAAIRDGLTAIGPEPKAPPQAMLLVEDFSPEALVLHLRDSRPWAGVFTSEGGVLVGGHAFNDEKAMATGALLNTLWDGNPIRRVRVLTGNAFLPGRRCSAHVMMQKVVADKLLGTPVLDGIGLMARMLIVEPESTVGKRPFRDTPGECAPILRFYNEHMLALLTREPTTAPDTTDVLDPPVMTLTADARALWVRFYDAVESDLGPGGSLHTIRAFGAKMGEHAGRLAAVLTVYSDPEAMEVDAEAMACGIALAQHYAAEMLRLQGGASISPDLRLAARLVTWWQERSDPRCYLAVIYQRGLNAVRDAATARRIVGVLEEHGWVRRLPPGIELDGSPRKEAWELVP